MVGPEFRKTCLYNTCTLPYLQCLQTLSNHSSLLLLQTGPGDCYAHSQLLCKTSLNECSLLARLSDFATEAIIFRSSGLILKASYFVSYVNLSLSIPSIISAGISPKPSMQIEGSFPLPSGKGLSKLVSHTVSWFAGFSILSPWYKIFLWIRVRWSNISCNRTAIGQQ